MTTSTSSKKNVLKGSLRQVFKAGLRKKAAAQLQGSRKALDATAGP
jgi:hypothetical protein